MTLDERKADIFEDAIRRQYWFELFMDDVSEQGRASVGGGVAGPVQVLLLPSDPTGCQACGQGLLAVRGRYKRKFCWRQGVYAAIVARCTGATGASLHSRTGVP